MAALLCAVFVLSGAAGLLFETLWFRQAGLAFGNSVVASSLVLASFMAGLALGSAWMARAGPDLRRPVLVYAGLEASIAFVGVALVWALPSLGGALASLLGSLPGPPWVFDIVRFGCGAVLLLLPATAMGATLPVIVRALQTDAAGYGPLLGLLYALNTGGAVVGSVAGELWLIEALGIRGTALAAGGLDLVAAAAALVIARSPRFRVAIDGALEGARRHALSPRALQLLGAAFASGAVLLALEVVWFRFLHLWILSNGLTFALVLAVVLSGIGLGGGLGGAWLRVAPDAARHASSVALVAGGLVCVLYEGFLFLTWPAAQSTVRYGWPALWQAAAIGGPVAFLSGVLFTLTGSALNEEVGLEARSTGLVTLWNTVGAALGSLAGGLLLLPLLGMERSFFVLAAGYGVVAWLVRVAERPGDRRSLPARIVALLFFGFSLVAFPFGLMRADYFTRPLRAFGYPNQRELVEVREGLVETVAVLRASLLDEPLYHQIVMGTFSMSEGHDFARRYQKLFAWWPVAMHPQPRRALLISYGMGATARALADVPELERIDLVDVSKLVFEMSTHAFADGEYPLDDPRVHAYVEDGRYFLQKTRDRYDIITAEPPSPRSEGAESLYTREYFQLVYDRLAEGGLNTHFVPIHLITLADAKAIIAAYCEVFEDCSLWTGSDLSWMLAGSRGPRGPVTSDQVARLWLDPRMGVELRRLGLEQPEQLGALFLGDAEQLAALVGDHPPLRDEFPKQLSGIERVMARGGYDELTRADDARERFVASRFIQRTWPSELRERTLPFFAFRGMAHRAIRRVGSFEERLEQIHRVQSSSELETLVLWLLRTTDLELRAVHRLIERGARSDAFAESLAAEALARRDFAAAARWYAQATALRPQAPHPGRLRDYATCMGEAVAVGASTDACAPSDDAAVGGSREIGESPPSGPTS